MRTIRLVSNAAAVLTSTFGPPLSAQEMRAPVTVEAGRSVSPRALMVRERSAFATLNSPPGSALVGRWEGDGFVLTVDQDAFQANCDPRKPFQWDPLYVLDAQSDMVVFELGGNRYIALISGDAMTLTQAGLSGHRSLSRKR